MLSTEIEDNQEKIEYLKIYIIAIIRAMVLFIMRIET